MPTPSTPAILIVILADEGDVLVQEIGDPRAGLPFGLGIILGAAKDGQPGGDGE